jgi:predicted P-loop ATPase
MPAKKRLMFKKRNDSHDELLLSTSNERLEAVITIYRGIHPTPQKFITLRELFSEISSDDVEKRTASRSMIHCYEQYLLDTEKGVKDAKKPYEDRKSQLKGFSVGDFSYRRDKKEHCRQYVPCFVFDLDGCKSTNEANLLLQKLETLPYVFAAFPSPSGHGLRIFVWVSATYETHRNSYIQVLKSLCDDLGVTTDKKNGVHFDSTCQNESRFFYYAAVDRNHFYLNLESVVFEVQKQTNFFENDKIKETIDIDVLMNQLDTHLKGYFEGRNDRLFHLAMRFKNNDVPIMDAERYASKFIESDFPMKEILNCIKSGYKTAIVQFTDEQKSHFLAATEDKTPPNEGIKKEKEPKLSNHQKTIEVEFEEGLEQSIHYYRQKRYKMQSSKSNYTQITQHLLHYYVFRRNIVANKIEYRLADKKNWERLNEADLIGELLEENFKNVEQALNSFLQSSRISNYDPLIAYFQSLPKWDGVDHIGQLANFVEAVDQNWWREMFKKALVRTIAVSTGVVNYNKQCVVLFGGTNAGKTKWIRFLVPPALKSYYNENPNFANAENKDAKISIAKNFITHLDEIGNATERELRAMKTYFSAESVNERLVYDRTNTQMMRKTTFWASTDRNHFLIDENGNVRFVVIEIKKINHDEGGPNGYNQNIDINKVWAQAYHLLNSGFKYQMSSDEIEYSEKNNTQQFMTVTKEEELILRYLQKAESGKEMVSFKTATDIAIYLEEFSKLISGQKVGKALKKLGFQQVAKKINGNAVRGYYVKFSKNEI